MCQKAFRTPHSQKKKKTSSKDLEKQIILVLWGEKLQFANKEWKEEKGF